MLERSSSAGSSSCAAAANGDEIASDALSEFVLTFMVVQIGLCVCVCRYAFLEWIMGTVEFLLFLYPPLGRGLWFNPSLDGIINKVLCSAKDVDR